MSNRTEKPTEVVKLTPTEQAFKIRVDAATLNIPRFVFRVWSAGSGGHPSLNTTATITPLAFSPRNKGIQPASCFYKLKPKKIATIANMHMRGQSDRPTLFFPLGPSPFPMYWNGLATTGTFIIPAMCLSLIQRPWTVLSSCSTRISCKKSSRSATSIELVAYGVISGPAYQAVPFSHIRALLGPSMSMTLVSQWIDVRSQFAETLLRALVSLYNDNFKLAVAAHCVAMCDGSGSYEEYLARQRLFRELSKFAVPAGWEHDPRIMNLTRSVIQFCRILEAVSAGWIIRDVVLKSLDARPS
jgi:hypothetical protein